jgi:hypothetical protein
VVPEEPLVLRSLRLLRPRRSDRERRREERSFDEPSDELGTRHRRVGDGGWVVRRELGWVSLELRNDRVVAPPEVVLRVRAGTHERKG